MHRGALEPLAPGIKQGRRRPHPDGDARRLRIRARRPDPQHRRRPPLPGASSGRSSPNLWSRCPACRTRCGASRNRVDVHYGQRAALVRTLQQQRGIGAIGFFTTSSGWGCSSDAKVTPGLSAMSANGRVTCRCSVMLAILLLAQLSIDAGRARRAGRGSAAAVQQEIAAFHGRVGLEAKATDRTSRAPQASHRFARSIDRRARCRCGPVPL